MIRTLLAALMFALAAPAAAQPYLFAGGAIASSASQSTAGERQSKIFLLPGAGYRFSRHLTLEAAVFDAGQMLTTSTVALVAPVQNIVTDRRFELSGASASLIGKVPLTESIALTGSASAYRLRGKVSEQDTLYTFGAPSADLGGRSTSGSGTTFGLGAGLSLQVSQAVEVRARLEWINGKDDVFGAGHDLQRLRLMSLSAAYLF